MYKIKMSLKIVLPAMVVFVGGMLTIPPLYFFAIYVLAIFVTGMVSLFWKEKELSFYSLNLLTPEEGIDTKFPIRFKKIYIQILEGNYDVVAFQEVHFSYIDEIETKLGYKYDVYFFEYHGRKKMSLLTLVKRSLYLDLIEEGTIGADGVFCKVQYMTFKWGMKKFTVINAHLPMGENDRIKLTKAIADFMNSSITTFAMGDFNLLPPKKDEDRGRWEQFKILNKNLYISFSKNTSFGWWFEEKHLWGKNGQLDLIFSNKNIMFNTVVLDKMYKDLPSLLNVPDEYNSFLKDGMPHSDHYPLTAVAAF